METPKNLKRVKNRTDPYKDKYEIYEGYYKVHIEYYEWSIDEVEGAIYEDDSDGWGVSEVDRMLDFVAIGVCQIKYGGITETMRNELTLDIPVWDSGVVDKFFMDDEEKKLVYEHLDIIKKYLKENEASEK